MSCIEFRNFVTFFGQIWCKISDILFIHNLWQKCLAPRQSWISSYAYMVQLTCMQGRLSPPTTMTLPRILTTPPFSAMPHSHPPHPGNNFWTFYTQFCAILCAFSVNFGSWQSGIMTPKNGKMSLCLKNRTPKIFSNISNRSGPISIIFGTDNWQ